MAFPRGQCYFANGTALPDTMNAFQPCKIDPVRTICCGINRDIPYGGHIQLLNESTVDRCLPNGLCENSHVDTLDGATQAVGYWATFCTNSDITSPDCLDVCRSTKEKVDTVRLIPCDGPEGTRWCCAGGLTLPGDDSCCTSNIDVVEIPRIFNNGQRSASSIVKGVSDPDTTLTSQIRSTSSSSELRSTSAIPIKSSERHSVPPPSGSSSEVQSMSPVQTSPLTVTSAIPLSQTSTPPSPTSTPPSQSKSHHPALSHDAQTGIITGAIFGVMALICVAVLLYMGLPWRKEAKRKSHPHLDAAKEDVYEYRPEMERGGMGIRTFCAELDVGYPAVVELPAVSPKELSAETSRRHSLQELP